MSKPVLYLFNGKVAKFGNIVLGTIPTPPPSFDSVQIGDQIWMSKNLAIDDGGEGISTKTVNYGQGDVVEYYYTWDAAVRVAASVTGWHLPTKDEWDALASYVGSSDGGKKLKSTYGWSSNRNGTDEFGFTGLPAGRYDDTPGYYAYFWSSTPKPGTTDAYCGYLGLTNGFSVSNADKTRSYSVRLIKDS